MCVRLHACDCVHHIASYDFQRQLSFQIFSFNIHVFFSVPFFGIVHIVCVHMRECEMLFLLGVLFLSLSRMRGVFVFPFFLSHMIFVEFFETTKKRIHFISKPVLICLQSICICLLCKVYLNIYYNCM